MQVHFQTPHQYVFVYENVKHLLLLWPKEAKKQLYIAEERNETLELLYPGETYEEMILDQVDSIFFCQLETEDGLVPVVLGATFRYRERVIAMYYNRENPNGPPFFFALENGDLIDIPDEEYEAVVRTFLREFPEYIQDGEKHG
ncbi:hypothetical protein [Desmospora activa]|uniref:Uncharacterized protein n=1 Tax=Desmospora activa DSM 45169 TaxID=1121389 RepID=A0A2T4ZAS7_9BACL|nr:hypothetical protein [Desmospora activa]PTM58990.1 hypothetical protein C8J48_1589 [Desmospora activa DSM 45169]